MAEAEAEAELGQLVFCRLFWRPLGSHGCFFAPLVQATEAAEEPQGWTCSKCDEPNKPQRDAWQEWGILHTGVYTHVESCRCVPQKMV